MRLSTSLSRNIMEATVGGILYKFKLGKRRHTLFFEDILSLYVEKCEGAGYGDDSERNDQKWGSLIIKLLVPAPLKKLPPSIVLNRVMKKIWVNLGLMDDFYFVKKGDIIKIKTKNEGVTRIIGENRGMVGFHTGILNSIFNCQVDCVKAEQTKKLCGYTFKLKNEPFSIESRTRDEYDKLNFLPPVEGYTLKDMLEKGVFKLKGNLICFRERTLIPVENTIFHIIGNQAILLEEVPRISWSYFKEIVGMDASDEKKLALLKTLLQVMGWGIVTIVLEEDAVSMEIKNPPYGLQSGKDNWIFLINVVLGYLWLLNDKFKVEKIDEGHKKLSIIYSCGT